MSEPADRTEYLSLNEVAERRGLHYMTVYRHVRTGRLPAIKEGGEWRVLASDLDQQDRRGSQGRPGHADIGYRVPALASRLVSGDEPGAWGIVESCLSAGADAAEVHHQLIIPAIHSIGDGWCDGDLGVVDEHTATAISKRVVSRLGPLMRAKGRSRGTIVLGAVAHDTHALAVSIVADILRAAHYNVIDLGGNTPSESFIDAIGMADQCRALGLSVSVTADDQVLATVSAVRLTAPTLPIVIGGTGVESADHAVQLGSAGYAANSRDVVPVFEQAIASAADKPLTDRPT